MHHCRERTIGAPHHTHNAKSPSQRLGRWINLIMRDRLWSHRFIAKYTNELLRALDELVLVGDERLVKFGTKKCS